MKKYEISKRLATIILASSLIVGDVVPTLAMQPADVDENVTVTTEETETTEVIETTEETETTEVTETIEVTEITEETETVEDTLLGSELEIPQIIGLKGSTNTDYVAYSNDESQCVKYIKLVKGSFIDLPGTLDDYKDETTGLYKYNGTYYADGMSDPSFCRLTEPVVAIFQDKPQEDSETKLYLVDGKYYRFFYSKYDENERLLCHYVIENDEVEVLGKVPADTDIKALYGKKIFDTDTKYRYYAVNGRCYDQISSRTVSNEKCVYAYKTGEISFEKNRHKISWHSVLNDNEFSINGKMCYVGYQVKIDGQMATLPYATADGQTLTEENSYVPSRVFDPGEQATYEVRAVYYIKTLAEVKNDEGKVVGSKYELNIIKTGEWSAPYTYSFVAQHNLQKIGKVTGLKAEWIDSKTVELNWDPVTEANYYEVSEIFSDTELNAAEIPYKDWTIPDKVQAQKTYYRTNTDKKYAYFRVRAYVGYSNETYDGNYGDFSEIVSVVKPDTIEPDTVTGLKAEEKTDGTFVLTWNKVDANTNVKIYYSTNPDVFSSEEFQYLIAAPYSVEKKQYLTKETEVATNVDLVKKQCASYNATGMTGVSSSNLNGTFIDEKYYFVAVGYIENKENRIDTTPYVLNKTDGTVRKYGRYNDVTISPVVSATEHMVKPKKPSTKSEKTAITMTFSKTNAITGYQIYRKDSKGKYKKITTTTSGKYVDKNLKENTTYSYKARAYTYNPVTKKTTYSKYVYFSAETSTNNYITVKAEKKSKNSVKVTWTKVAGAEKYEIYRTSTSSNDNAYSEKDGTASNRKWKLIKTITKAKTTSYMDKKLNAGETYSYRVIACYKSGKQIKEIDDEDTVVLDLEMPQNVVVMLKGSTVKVSWDADKYAKSYEVRYQKYDSQGRLVTENPVIVSTKKVSYNITGINAGEKISASVRATNGKEWTSWTSYSSETMGLPSVTGVSVKNVTAKDATGVERKGVEIKWKAVPGAAFYKVWRSTSPEGSYNKDTKLYNIPADNIAISKASNTNQAYNNVYYTEYKGKTGSIVGTSAIDFAQLEPGVTYYYYVAAYAENEVARSYNYIKGAKVTFDTAVKIKSAKATKGKVTVTIDKVAGAKKYVVYRSTKKSGGYKQIGTTKKTTYVDKKVKKGKTYYYKVVAVGVNGLKADFETGMSKAVKVKAK